jgi:hypothetical protein
LRARLTEAEGCKRIAEFSENFLGGTVNGPLRVVAANYPVGIVNLSGRGMLVVSVARQLGSGDPFVRLLCCSAQAERGRERRPESVNLTMPAGKPEYLCPALFTGRTTRLFVNS